MGFEDLREYLGYLEENGLLKKIAKEVDRDWEIAAVCREVFVRYDKETRPGLLFESVEDFEPRWLQALLVVQGRFMPVPLAFRSNA